MKSRILAKMLFYHYIQNIELIFDYMCSYHIEDSLDVKTNKHIFFSDVMIEAAQNTLVSTYIFSTKFQKS